jgi:hypothetical protein
VPRRSSPDRREHASRQDESPVTPRASLKLIAFVGRRTHRASKLGYALANMDRVYDIFEKLPDGSLMWKTSVAGHEKAIQQLRELAKTTANECLVMHLPTKTLIATMNASKSERAESAEGAST